MAQVARAHTEALGGPDRTGAPLGPVPGHGPAGEGDRRVTGRWQRADGRAVVSSEAVQEGKRIIRSGRSRHPVRLRLCSPPGGRVRARPTISSMLTERQELVLRTAGRGLPRRRRARRLARPLSTAFEWGPSTIRHELANLEELGLLAHPHTSAGRIPTEAGYRYFVDRLLPAPSRPVRALAVAGPPGGRRRDAGHDRGPVPGHQPAGHRHRAPDRDLDDPPHRGPGAPAPGADGRRHHLDRRRHQAPVHLPRPVDTGLADWAASYLNERLVGLGLGARMLHQRLYDPSLSPPRPISSTRWRRFHRARGVRSGDALRRGDGQAADASAASPTSRSSTC